MKYDIRNNPPSMSSEDIAKHKNFDALFAQFEQNPAPSADTPDNSLPVEKTAALPRWLGWSAGLAAASVAVLLVVNNLNEPTTEQFKFANPLALQAPLPSLDKPFAQFSVEDRDTLLTSASGSTIKIPAAAFVDQQGKPIKGKVDIKYREMHDHVDLFLAGVPQQPKHKNRQTAAAVQIQGYHNGQPVYINTDKKLEVALRSTVPAEVPTEKLQVFAYDQPNDSWNYQNADKVEIINGSNPNNGGNSGSNQPVLSEKEYLAQLQKQYPLPTAPSKPNNEVEETREVFDFDVDPNEFPEFASYRNLKWVATSKDIPYNNEDKNREWNEVAITKTSEGGYQLFLKEDKSGRAIQFAVAPISDNKKESEKLYQQQMAEYQAQKTRQEAAIAAALSGWKNSQISTGDSIAPAEKLVIHHFSVSQFGLWACTNEQFEPNNLQAAQVESNQNLTQIYLAQPNSRFYQSSNPNEPISVPKQALIWATNPQQQIFIGREQDNKLVFTEISPKSESELRRKLQPTEIYN